MSAPGKAQYSSKWFIVGKIDNSIAYMVGCNKRRLSLIKPYLF